MTVPTITLPCEIIAVTDGDTVRVDVTFRMNIRLLDAWSPEITGKEKVLGLAAKRRLAELVLHKKGTLTIPFGGNDLGDSFTFGRTLGRIEIGGKDVSEVMVTEGYATKTKGGK